MSTTDRQPRSSSHLPEEIRAAVAAARDKKAADLTVLDLRKAGAFTDYFVICSGNTVRQLKTIADAVEQSLSRLRVQPSHVEGYGTAGWILLDYFDFVVHIFTPDMRRFYSLERLWGSAKEVPVPEDAPPSTTPRA
jgi:ribosome-associated protein